MTARFHLGDILSVTAGKFMPPDGIGSIYDLLNHMTGDNLFTHQLPRASRECAPELLRQHPDLADIQPPEFRDEAHVWSWLAEQTDRYGTHRVVQPLPVGDHTRIDPLDELAMNYPHVSVIPVAMPNDTPHPKGPTPMNEQLLYEAWTLIANAGEGDWNRETPEWRKAAERWRDNWHEWLASRTEPTRED